MFTIKYVYHVFIVNFDNTVGAVGVIPPWMQKFYPMAIIKIDEDGKPLRDSNGLVIKCGAGEIGELVGKISRNSPFRDFKG